MRNVLREKRGEGYIDIAVGVLCLMLVIALAVSLFLFLWRNSNWTVLPMRLSDRRKSWEVPV